MPELIGSLSCFFDEKTPLRESMIVGGFLIPKIALLALDHSVIQVKNSLGLEETDPIKWNMHHSKCSQSLRKLSREQIPVLRERMVSLASNLPIQIIMSHVWMGTLGNQMDAWKWSFDNILQRLSIILDRKREELEDLQNYPFLDVVFDWLPGRGHLKFYFDVYRDAYVHGFRFQKNFLPPLRDFKACPCLVASSCLHSLALQLTDFFIGATGDFFTWCYKGSEEHSVRNYFCNFFHAFRRDDQGNVIGPGMIVKGQSKAKIRIKLHELNLI